MKVFYHGKSRNHRLYVQPGVDAPYKKEWHEEDGKPKTFEVLFINGVADVEDRLAQYLIEKQLASAIMPIEAA